MTVSSLLPLDGVSSGTPDRGRVSKCTRGDPRLDGGRRVRRSGRLTLHHLFAGLTGMTTQQNLPVSSTPSVPGGVSLTPQVPFPTPGTLVRPLVGRPSRSPCPVTESIPESLVSFPFLISSVPLRPSPGTSRPQTDQDPSLPPFVPALLPSPPFSSHVTKTYMNGKSND